MKEAFSIRTAAPADFATCLEIAFSLPNFFTHQAVDEKMRADLQRFGATVAVLEEAIVGFAVVCQKTPSFAEILWLAVRAEQQGKGAGTALVEHVCASFKAEGIRGMEVKTLAPLAGAENYVPTRRFYEARGFECLEIIDPYPDWDPGNPCAIYLRPL